VELCFWLAIAAGSVSSSRRQDPATGLRSLRGNLLHYVEHVAVIPDKRIRRFQVPVLDDGRRVWRGMEEFDTSGDGVQANWPNRFFAEIVDAYLTATGNQGGQVGNAASYILGARGLLDFALPLMEAVAIDPRAAHN
jgi:aminoglycoside N3'-acetyltransferase